MHAARRTCCQERELVLELLAQPLCRGPLPGVHVEAQLQHLQVGQVRHAAVQGDLQSPRPLSEPPACMLQADNNMDLSTLKTPFKQCR